MDPIRALLDVVQGALKQAVPEVGGRVYLRRNISRHARDVSFLQVSLGDESIEELDESPYTVMRTRTFNIVAAVRGDLEETYDKVLTLRERIIAIMREIQIIPGETDGAPCLIDRISPSGESEPDIIAGGEKYYTGVMLSYEAAYVTDEGSPGIAGPGIPQFNVLEVLQRAFAKWTARRGEQVLQAEDQIEYEETSA